MDDLMKQDWYLNMVDECKDIITEATFASRWALIEGYHQLGNRILKENDNFERKKIYGKDILHHVGESLGLSTTTLYYAIQFAKKYKDVNSIPEGKNISWHKLCSNYLPARLETEKVSRDTEKIEKQEIVKQGIVGQMIEEEIAERELNLEINQDERTLTLELTCPYCNKSFIKIVKLKNSKIIK